MAVRWDTELYLRFARERTQPCIDLIGRVRLEAPAWGADLATARRFCGGAGPRVQ
jgi:trans-aconitate methyltransferase